ncbi:YkvA family protein [Gloeocapsopsis dulcis]|uniref:DUF1232 domain-containing protein n=1 Tax=Gloeocapsopsis dulcis AAB1 = 1H9 TaxID=1433147 RepID=A0A6N8FT42_9CHRO|nr:YkvA family protein [Gloeocapsopsis dulcis]MUL36029.1 hypothetical protein [Gloeocapsopsis dulcis AAB1 = 1H9]WNN88282.1 YkvA family protein [Gloeocapsopsis dulcis]
MNFSIQAVYNWYRNLLRNPKYRWWVVLGTAFYFLLPFDVAPDFLPVVGQIDDVFLISLLVAEISQILIEGVKARKADTEPKQATNEGNVGSTASTIDVDAVSVK